MRGTDYVFVLKFAAKVQIKSLVGTQEMGFQADNIRTDQQGKIELCWGNKATDWAHFMMIRGNPDYTIPHLKVDHYQ